MKRSCICQRHHPTRMYVVHQRNQGLSDNSSAPLGKIIHLHHNYRIIDHYNKTKAFIGAKEKAPRGSESGLAKSRSNWKSALSPDAVYPTVDPSLNVCTTTHSWGLGGWFITLCSLQMYFLNFTLVCIFISFNHDTPNMQPLCTGHQQVTDPGPHKKICMQIRTCEDVSSGSKTNQPNWGLRRRSRALVQRENS